MTKKHIPTAEQRRTVEALAGYGIAHERIGQVIDISWPTLLKNYRAELDRGASAVEANLIANLLRLTKGSDGTALKAIMFSLQCRFGWSPYLPAPVREEPLGKKETQRIEAQTAHEQSSWGELVH